MRPDLSDELFFELFMDQQFLEVLELCIVCVLDWETLTTIRFTYLEMFTNEFEYIYF